MASLLPINFLADATDALGWAHCIFTTYCQLHQWANYVFPQALLMPQDGPIALLAATANGFALAHYFSGRCCRCPRMGLWHLYQPLLVALIWPIFFFQEVLPMPKIGPLHLQLLLPMA